MQNIITALTTLLPLAAAAPFSLAARDDNAGCTSKSFNHFKWTIEDFDYHSSYLFTTPAHQNSWGYVNFNVTNPALDYKASCKAASNQLSEFFYGTMVYDCTTPENTSAETTFAFSRPSGQLDLNQTWTCSDEDPQYPITIHAYGSLNLTLDCKDEKWENPDWQMGEIYSSRTVTCDLVTEPMKPYRMEAIA
ncbi:hypothetical protein DL768_011149 [Monosporascus sp. mg162]|nr:hypothetical protein DL768_011149 [Monosporascus sp. mg162]